MPFLVEQLLSCHLEFTTSFTPSLHRGQGLNIQFHQYLWLAVYGSAHYSTPGYAGGEFASHMPSRCSDARVGGERRTPRGAAVVARERLPLERGDVRVRGGGRAPRDAAVGALERLPVGQEDVLTRDKAQATQGVEVGKSERLPHEVTTPARGLDP